MSLNNGYMPKYKVDDIIVTKYYDEATFINRVISVENGFYIVCTFENREREFSMYPITLNISRTDAISKMLTEEERAILL